MKGQKICSSCSKPNGPRSFVCKYCNTPFIFKAKSRDQKNTKIIRDINWKELQYGDVIKVNGGPYFLNKEGEYIPMGYRGRFIVQKVDDKGIIACGKDKFSGFCHIYMGPDYQSKDTGLWKIKHKLLKLKPKKDLV